MRGCCCANNNILCIYGILNFLYLVSFKKAVIVLLIVAALTPITTLVSNTLYY